MIQGRDGWSKGYWVERDGTGGSEITVGQKSLWPEITVGQKSRWSEITVGQLLEELH